MGQEKIKNNLGGGFGIDLVWDPPNLLPCFPKATDQDVDVRLNRQKAHARAKTHQINKKHHFPKIIK